MERSILHTYKTRVAAESFDLIDVPGREKWRILFAQDNDIVGNEDGLESTGGEILPLGGKTSKCSHNLGRDISSHTT